MTAVKISIDCELGVSWADAGQWRAFHLDCTGSTAEELLRNAHIVEIDQDGGEIDVYPLEYATNEVITSAENAIKRVFEKAVA